MWLPKKGIYLINAHHMMPYIMQYAFNNRFAQRKISMEPPIIA
jgi:hypothetical protein